MTRRTFYGFLLGTALLAAPMAAAQAVTELRPTGQWLVNSAGVQGLAQVGATQTPCIMANQYNNGFILRMAGGSGRILSVSIDFRQNIFAQGASYPAVISVDGGTAHQLTATAFSPGILVLGAAHAQGFYEQVQAGRSLAVNLAGQTVVFSLDNAGDGLRRLESCFSPPAMSQERVAGIPTARDTEVYIKRDTAAARDTFKQPSAQDLLKASAEEPVNSRDALDVPVVTASAMTDLPPLTPQEMAALDLTPEDVAPYEGGMGVAKKSAAPVATAAAATSALGEGMRVAASGSSAARVSSMTPSTSPSVPSVEAAPLKMASAPEKPSFTPRPPSDVPSPKAPTPPNTVSVMPTPVVSAPPTDITPRRSPVAPVQTAQWQAEAGEDIREVLTRWAERAGTEVVWEADRGGQIARDVSLDGSFEDAVAQVMADNAAALGIAGQFEGGRPLSGSQSALASAMNARAGDNLRDVVQRWAMQNDVELNWRAGEQFTLQQAVSGQGDFAAALEAALTQFDDEDVRPVGQLNRDPATGRLSLTIETDRTT